MKLLLLLAFALALVLFVRNYLRDLAALQVPDIVGNAPAGPPGLPHGARRHRRK